MDGGVDYSKYSVQQLREAEAGIDRTRFPINYSRLRDELNRRGYSSADHVANTITEPHREPVCVALKKPATLMWISIALGPVVLVLDWKYLVSMTPASSLIITEVIVIALGAWLTYKMARGRNWSRIAILVLTILGLSIYVTALVYTFLRTPFIGVINSVQLVMQATAIYMMFTEPGDSEFRRRKKP